MHTGLVETRDGDGTRRLISNVFPIISLSSIVVKMPDADYTMDLTDFVFDAGTGFIEFHGRQFFSQFSCFPPGKQNIVLTYTAGFVDVPDPVQQGVAVWTAETCLSLTKDTSLAGETLSKYAWRSKTVSNSELAEPPIEARKFLVRYRNLLGSYVAGQVQR